MGEWRRRRRGPICGVQIRLKILAVSIIQNSIIIDVRRIIAGERWSCLAHGQIVLCDYPISINISPDEFWLCHGRGQQGRRFGISADNLRQGK